MHRFTSAWLLSAVLGFTGLADAALVLDFKPEPTNELPELIYAGVGPAVPMLREGPGSVATGDSNLPPEQQISGGLTVEVPYLIPDIPGADVNEDAGTTTFRDVTLRLTGLQQSGAPVSNADVITQNLSAGTFRFLAGDGLGAPSILLLEGTIADATIVHLNTGDTGAVFSTTVTYTGGLIPAIIGLAGDLSFSLLNITDLFTAGPDVVADFTADSTGQFSVVPEPAAAAFLGCAAGALLLRPRHRRHH